MALVNVLRTCYVLASFGVRSRYNRSKVGQWWISLGTAITIGSFGVVWSFLWGLPIAEYLPYVAASTIIWGFMSACLVEACDALSENERLFQSSLQPAFSAVLIVWLRNVLLFFHNIVVLILVGIVFGFHFEIIRALDFIIFLILSVILVFYMIPLSYLGLRFRDVKQVMFSLMQIGFFLTPVMWRPEFLPAAAAPIIEYNPLAGMLLSGVNSSLLTERIIFLQPLIIYLLVGLSMIPVSVFLHRRIGRRYMYWF